MEQQQSFTHHSWTFLTFVQLKVRTCVDCTYIQISCKVWAAAEVTSYVSTELEVESSTECGVMSSTAHDLIRNSARDVIAVYNCLFSSCRQRFASDSVSVRRHSDQHTGLQQLYRVLTSQQRERHGVIQISTRVFDSRAVCWRHNRERDMVSIRSTLRYILKQLWLT